MSGNDNGPPRSGLVRPDVAQTVLVLADEALAERAPTLGWEGFAPAEASQLAAAALEDTLVVIKAARVQHRVVVGDVVRDPWRRRLSERGLAVVDRVGGPVGERLVAAFGAAALLEGDRPVSRRPRARLLLGADTPQVTRSVLETSWEGADAVIGLGEDGGCWAIGLREDIDPVACFLGIARPGPRSGSAQLNRLVDLGLRVTLLPPLRQIGRPDDAEVIAYQHPRLLFSEVHRRLRDRSARQPADRVFDHGYAGRPLRVQRDGAEPTLHIDLRRWSSPADDVDRLVVARCEAPVLDLGCGPGRMVRALTESGLASLGVDISAAAVDLSMQAGAPALRARLEDPLPGEGRWGTVLLIDGNVGIGGDVSRLLERCRSLVAPGGLVLCEVDPAPERHEDADLLLHSHGMTSTLCWSRIGARALGAVAARLGLWVAEEWSAGGRVFVALRRGS